MESILDLSSHPELFRQAAEWFGSKWGVPVQAYLDSMEESRRSESGVPRWYVILAEDGSIAAGLGVIANDFHKRPDLTPNICAVYVEKPCRGRGTARRLLEHACGELARRGITCVYLITAHAEFYEHCGWSFYGMIEEDDGNMIRMYQHVQPVPEGVPVQPPEGMKKKAVL